MINIIVLNFNSSRDTISCVRSVLETKEKDIRLVIIDNGSRNEEVYILREYLATIKNLLEVFLIENGFNYGYAKGNNIGIRYLLERELFGDVLILNPDVIISPTLINEMQKTLKSNEKIAAVMARTYYNNREYYDYIRLNGLFTKYMQSNKKWIETDYIAGSCFMIKWNIVDFRKLFKEEYFMYWEEVDLSIRLRQLGYKLISTTETYIHRKRNDVTRNINATYFYFRNSFLFYRYTKSVSSLGLFIFICSNIIKYSLISVLHLKCGFIRNAVRGVRDGFRCII